MPAPTTLYQIVSFVDAAVGDLVSLPHNISVNGTSVLPDFIVRDNPQFEITEVTATTITVVNRGTSEATCNIWVQLLHSMDRAFGGPTSLDPRPFIVGGYDAGPTLYSPWTLGNSTDYNLAAVTLDDLTFDDQITSYQVFNVTNSGDLTATITGMDASALNDGAMITIFFANGEGFDLTFAHDTGSAGTNRFALPADTDVVLSGTNGQITFRYNSTLERWTLFAKTP